MKDYSQWDPATLASLKANTEHVRVVVEKIKRIETKSDQVAKARERGADDSVAIRRAYVENRYIADRAEALKRLPELLVSEFFVVDVEHRGHVRSATHYRAKIMGTKYRTQMFSYNKRRYIKVIRIK